MEIRPAGEVEVRETEDGPHLYGSLIQEGRAARRRRELFAPGSVGWPAQGVGIVTEHWSTSPEVRAMPERQPDGRITIRAPANDAIRAAVAAGKSNLSVEFFPIRERRTAGGIREITKCFVDMAALVPSAEYPDTGVEVRQTGGYRTGLKTRRPMDCKCAGGKASAVEFTADAFAGVEGLDVTAISRGAESVIASTATDSLALRRTAGGGLGISLSTLDTEAGRRTRELLDAGQPVYARPVWTTDQSEFEVVNGVAVVSRAWFAYLLVRPVPKADAKGLDPLVPGGGARAAVIPWERRRLLLL